jgi:hypothetical protein
MNHLRTALIDMFRRNILSDITLHSRTKDSLSGRRQVGSMVNMSRRRPVVGLAESCSLLGSSMLRTRSDRQLGS